MANQWFRLYAEFAHDPKVQMMGEKDQRRLIMLFCFRCNVTETLQDQEVAFQLRVSLDEWLVTKALFVEKKFIDEHNKILNWDKRQFVSDSSTERVRKHRDKVKRSETVTVTPPEQNRTDTEQIQNRTERESEGKQTVSETTSEPADESPPPPSPPDPHEEYKKEYRELTARYSLAQRKQISTCIKNLATTRKSSRIAESVILAMVRKFDTQPIDRVMHGIKTYLDNELHLDGKDEKYLWGIIRRANQGEMEPRTRGQTRQRYNSPVERDIDALDKWAAAEGS